MTEQEYIEKKYLRFNEVLVDCLSKLNKLEVQSNDFAKLRAASKEKLSSQLEIIKKEAKKNLENIVWDKLVVAFFGETNAGKSTTIETCRIIFNEATRDKSIRENKLRGGNGHVDGLIIGDGRSDFTRTYDKYSMQVDSRPFSLVDMPGIEGDEKESIVEEKIHEALLNAHCVFYVLSKIPDEKILKKIADYLQDWVLVYSIYNVRNGMFRTDEQRRTLLNSDVEKAAHEISGKFQRQLPKNYDANITVHSHLALFSKADFHSSREDLIGKQQKMRALFGDALFGFSHFDDLISAIRNNAADFRNVIKKANERKISELAKRAYENVTAMFNEQEEHLKSLEVMIARLDQGLSDSAGKFRAELKNQTNAVIDAVFRDMKEDIFKELENQEDSVEKKKTSIGKSFENGVNSIIEKYGTLTDGVMGKVRDSVQKKVEGFNKASGLEITLVNTSQALAKSSNIGVDADNITSSFGFDIKKFGVGAVEVASLTAAGARFGAWVSGPFAPLGAGIGAAVGWGFALWRNWVESDDGLGKAKEMASQQLAKAKENVRSCFVAQANNEAMAITDYTNHWKRVLNVERANISKYREAFEDARRDLRQFADFRA